MKWLKKSTQKHHFPQLPLSWLCYSTFFSFCNFVIISVLKIMPATGADKVLKSLYSPQSTSAPPNRLHRSWQRTARATPSRELIVRAAPAGQIGSYRVPRAKSPVTWTLVQMDAIETLSFCFRTCIIRLLIRKICILLFISTSSHVNEWKV